MFKPQPESLIQFDLMVQGLPCCGFPISHTELASACHGGEAGQYTHVLAQCSVSKARLPMPPLLRGDPDVRIRDRTWAG